MSRPSLFSWVIAGVAALALPGIGGCGKEKLTEIEVPDAGVSLRYDLAAGQVYGGHIRMRNAVQTPMGDLIQSIEFDVDMVAAGPVGDKTLMRAKVDGIKLDIRLPEGVPAGMGGSIPPEAIAAVNGMELRFNIDARGDVSDMPEPPKEAAQEIQAVIGMVSGALQSGFIKLPEQALKNGDSWNAIDTDEQEPGRTGTGKFTGMARHETNGEDVAKLEYAFERKDTGEAGKPGQPRMGNGNQQIEALFSVQGYPVKVARKMNGEIKGLGGMASEVTAEWKKLGKRGVEPPAGGPSEVQEITDPCDPDYVGGEECVENGAAEAATPTESDPEAPTAENPSGG